jgi:predicted permease
MRKLRAWLMRLAGLFGAGRHEADFAEELESHIALHVEDGVRNGLSPAEARRQALLRLGGAEQTRQAYRERASLPWMESLLRDVRYALRGFRRNPVFTVTVIATLALGIGATTAVLSVVDRILFRPLPYAHGDRLVSFGLSQPLEVEEFTLGAFFFEWRDNQKPFSSVTYERGVSECDLTEQSPVHLQCAEVAGNFLPTLGVSPVVGRNFLPEEDQPHGPKAAMLSYAVWLSRYNRDAAVGNKTIDIDGHPFRIVGVLPRDFEMPRLQPTDLLLPAQLDRAEQHTVNSTLGYPMWAFARLKPGISVAEAREEMDPLFRHTQLWIPAEFRSNFHLQVRSVRDRQMHDAYSAAWVLLGAVIAVLLIACANVASLFSARAASMQRELAVRSALGATRWRLMRATLIEALLLAAAGGAAGCLLAEILLRIFLAIAPTGIPFLASAALYLRILCFAGVMALACAVLCGMAPARHAARAADMTSRMSRVTAHARLRRTLVALQIAMSVILLSCASLLLRSFWSLEQQSLGMKTRDVIKVSIPLVGSRYPTGNAYMDFYLRAEAALRRLPGITAVAMSDSVPPDGDGWHHDRRIDDLFVQGRPHSSVRMNDTVIWRDVTPQYFRVLSIPIVEGRGFTEDEQHSGDAIVLSRQLARRLFPDGGAVGQHIQFANYDPYFKLDGPVYAVVGVADDVKNAGLAGESQPEYYKLRGDHDPAAWDRHCAILLDTSLPVSVVGPWVRSQIAQIDPLAPVEFEPLGQSVSKLADRPRFEAALLGLFAACGLLMAVIGLYGVIAFVAAQRTQEIGVRMALGATRRDILRLIAAEGVRLIVLGAVLGLGIALGAAHLLKSLLFHVGTRDPVSYIAVTLVLGLVALAATLIPARAAMKTDPMQALRAE